MYVNVLKGKTILCISERDLPALLTCITVKQDLIRMQIRYIYFGCLRKGHRNEDCRRKQPCRNWKGIHPSCLHDDRSSTMERHCEVRETNLFGVSRGYTHSTTMIVPVWVPTQDNTSHESLTYAFLDKLPLFWKKPLLLLEMHLEMLLHLRNDLLFQTTTRLHWLA